MWVSSRYWRYCASLIRIMNRMCHMSKLPHAFCPRVTPLHTMIGHGNKSTKRAVWSRRSSLWVIQNRRRKSDGVRGKPSTPHTPQPSSRSCTSNVVSCLSSSFVRLLIMPMTAWLVLMSSSYVYVRNFILTRLTVTNSMRCALSCFQWHNHVWRLKNLCD